MGDNIFLGDRNGVRTPMQWSGDRNAGFSRADPERVYAPVNQNPVYHYQYVNVETQLRTPTSLLNWVRRLIKIRKRYPIFGRGGIEFLLPENEKILAYVREDGDQAILVANNLSRFSQAAELNLRRFAGRVPVEMHGETVFPEVGELPYLLTFAPHGFYWFRLERVAR
jgi:maltose alpha-D-glucosyltransferase/alpha-amylase